MVDPVRILDHEPDWRAALAYLENNLGASPDQIILVGHSMGATMVMDAARKASFRLSVPIGLGDWNLILDNPEKISDHVNKIKANTGVSIDPALLRPNKAQYSPEVVFASCPLTPVRLIYAGRDDGPHTLFPYINEAQEECADLIGWRFVPYSDHMYGTELAGYPRPVRDLYSRLSLSLLKWQLLGLIGSSKP
jgi:pimeloyl-ACP methyl ester carboxylesterase